MASVIETEYFEEENLEVVTTDFNGGGFLSGMKKVKIRKIYYPLFNGKKIPAISYLISIIHAFFLAIKVGHRYDRFYINTITPYFAAIAGRLLGKEIIYHIHEKFIGNSLEKRLIEYVFQNTKADCFFVSNYVLQKYKGIENNAIVKYNKLPKSFLSDVQIVPLRDRSRTNVILISSLAVAKGVFQYVTLAKSMTDYKFTLVLSASQAEINLFMGEDVLDNLTIVAAQSNIHPFLRRADLLLNLSIPSLSIETFGLTIVEAMAYGIPSIVPNVGGPVELIIDGYNGFCVDVTNLNLLEDKIRECLGVGNYDQMSRNALDRVKLFI